MLDPRTPAGAAHLARLARLALEPEELDGLAAHLGKVLDWVATLDALETEGVSASAHDDAAPALRPDEPRASLLPGQALANAPDRSDGGFRVPAVLGGEAS